MPSTPPTPPVVDRKVLLPFVLITSLFALWGFANAVTDPMVQAFKKVLELSNAQAAWVQMAFYGGYFSMALPAALFVRRYSYKSGILVGLGLYAAGALLFYPAAVTEQFWFFCLGLYILTFGLAFLETTANPYILAMGDPRTAIRRLNLAQAFNPVGLLLGLLVAQRFVLRRLQSDDVDDFGGLDLARKAMVRTADLLVIRDPYVVLGLVILGVLLLIAVSKMPQARNDGGGSDPRRTLVALLGNRCYAEGVVVQAFYVGAQIMCWTYIYQYAEAGGLSAETAANYQFVAFVLFLGGRAVGTALLRYVAAAGLLVLFAALAVGLSVGVIFSAGPFGLYCLVGLSFAMSIMFPTIYGLALEGLPEEDAKIGAAGLVMAIVGGALMPRLQGQIIDLGGNGVADLNYLGVPEVNLSFCLPLLCFVVVGFYGWRNR